jgi:HEAT repeat protein
MLSDPDDTVKSKAAIILGRVGTPALPALLSMLSHSNATNRCLAAFAIGEIGADAAHLIPKLEPLLTDKSSYPRLSSAEALRKLNAEPHTFVPVLLNCLRDGDSDTIAFASDILAHTTNAASLAVPALLQMAVTNRNQVDREAIYSALNSLDPEAAATIRTNIFPQELGH